MLDDKDLVYHPVAVQSFWRPESRVVFACPLPDFAEAVYQTLVEVVGQGKLADPFDAEKAASYYREVIAQLDAQTTDEDKATVEALAKRLRDEWKEWQGEDSLHQVAFGKREDYCAERDD